MRTATDQLRTGLDWEDVRHFAALARAGTLSAAARALGVHHATVARRVSALETALGRPLFERRAGTFTLAAAGRATLERAAEMERAAAALAEGAAGATATRTVRLTSTRALLDGFLLARLAPLVTRHPELELELVGESRTLSLARHETDLALRMGPPRQGDLVGRRVASVAYAFYASPAVAATVERGQRPRRIGFDEASRAIVPEAAWLAEAWPDERPSYRASGFLSQQLAARAGLGVVLLPRFMGDPDPALVRVAQEPAHPPRPLWLLRRASAARDPAVRAVADFLVALFARERATFSRQDA